jgi:hypothetical protein
MPTVIVPNAPHMAKTTHPVGPQETVRPRSLASLAPRALPSRPYSEHSRPWQKKPRVKTNGAQRAQLRLEIRATPWSVAKCKLRFFELNALGIHGLTPIYVTRRSTRYTRLAAQFFTLMMLSAKAKTAGSQRQTVAQSTRLAGCGWQPMATRPRARAVPTASGPLKSLARRAVRHKALLPCAQQRRNVRPVLYARYGNLVCRRPHRGEADESDPTASPASFEAPSTRCPDFEEAMPPPFWYRDNTPRRRQNRGLRLALNRALPPGC